MHPCGRPRNKQLKNTKLSKTIEAREASRAEGRSPYLLWLIWVLWLPFIIPAFVSLFQAHLTIPRLIGILIGATLFLAIYLLASWRRAQSLVATSSLPRHPGASTWLTIVVLTVLSLVLVLLGGSAWLGLFFIYMWLCRRESPSSLDNTYGNRDRTACHSNWLVYRYWLAQSCANDRFHPRNHYYYKSCNVVDHNELGIRHSTERDSPFSRNDRTATYCAGSA